ncbi:MAG TPA: hypothetical protein VER04_15615, partial [Polyangiaceae bacterium]|nr:hypothetical protein [Polyangiaceae bacterium]
EVSGGAWSASAGRAPVAGGSRSVSHAGTGSTLRAGAPTIGPGGAAGWSGGDVAPPECWQIGSCGGDSGELVADAGAGGSDDSSPGECNLGKGCIVAQGNAIRELTADTENIYWVEHGTFDELGNYDNDGRLLKRGLSSGAITELARQLPGPLSVAVTPTHVFMYLDQVWDGKLRFSLARVPIAGGAAQIVALDASSNGSSSEPCRHCLVHANDTLYFPSPEGVFKIAAGDAQPSPFSPLHASSLAIAGEYLYLVTRGVDSVWRVSLAGGVATQLSAEPLQGIQVWGDSVYSLDAGGSTSYLARMPATGGPWLRLPKAQRGFADELQIAGGWFTYSMVADGGQKFVVGPLSDSGSALITLVLPWNSVTAWVGTAQGIFWTGGRVIRQRLNTE